jgi:hypothetical protein
LEIQLLYAVKNQDMVNWAYVMLHHMGSHNEKSAALPHARFLTKVFKKFKVNLNNELCYSMTVNDCEISSAVINRKMGVFYDSVGHTISYMDDDESPPPPQQPPPAEQPIKCLWTLLLKVLTK